MILLILFNNKSIFKLVLLNTSVGIVRVAFCWMKKRVKQHSHHLFPILNGMNNKYNVSEKYHAAETNFFQCVECQKFQLLKLPVQGCYCESKACNQENIEIHPYGARGD